MKVNDSLIVGFDFTNGIDEGILIVGHKDPRKDVEIINAFQGEEAYDLYLKLITKKEK